MSKTLAAGLVALAMAGGILIGATVRPAQADGADELHRTREATERIAKATEKIADRCK